MDIVEGILQDSGAKNPYTLWCATASAIAFVDTGAFLLAVPRAAMQLQAPFLHQQLWVAGALAALGSTVVLGGWLGDRHGHARVMRWGLVGHVCVSLLTAFAWTAPVLTIARIGVGLVSALYVPTSLALLGRGPDSYRSVATWTATTSVAVLSAPIVGALLTSWDWRAVPLAEAVMAAVVLVGLSRVPAGTHPPSRGALPGGVGRLGLGGAAVVLGSALLGGQVRIIVVAAGSLVALLGLVALRRSQPEVLPRRTVFLHGFTAWAYAAMGLVPFALTIYLQETAGWSPLRTGLVLSVDGLTLAVLTAILQRRRRSTSRLLVVGALIAVVGAGMLAVVPEFGLLAAVVGLVVTGCGAALYVVPLTNGVIAEVPSDMSARSSAINLAVARFAAGVAISVALPVMGLTWAYVADASPEVAAAGRSDPLDVDAAPPLEDERSRAAVDAAFRVGMLLAAAGYASAAVTAHLGRRWLPTAVPQPSRRGGKPGDQDELDDGP